MPADTLFASLVAHELTHAYVEHSLGDRELPRVAHEYLAYALQLDLLSDAERASIIEVERLPMARAVIAPRKSKRPDRGRNCH
jgi:hypothetical protein